MEQIDHESYAGRNYSLSAAGITLGFPGYSLRKSIWNLCNDSLSYSIWSCLLDGEKNCGNRGADDVAPYCHFCYNMLLTVCSTGWIHVENIGTVKGRKMFLVVALAGNITGGLLTWTKGGGQVFEDGYELKRRKMLMKKIYGIRGRRRNRQCLCTDPGKRTGKGEDTGQPEVLTKEEDEEQKLLEFVANYNSELEDS